MPIYDLKSDISARGWDVGNEKIDRRKTYNHISPELKIVPTAYPYMIRLEEMPYRASGVVITGYTEILVMPTSNNKFYVDYENSSIYFHSGQAGELVSIYYYGMGSVVAANDVNRFANFLCCIKSFLTSFLVESSDPTDKNVSLTGGYINKGTELAFISDKILWFGAGQEYEVSAMSMFYWRKLLVSVNISTEEIIVTEGAESVNQEDAVLPAVPVNCKPCSVVSVQDDGNAGAGTIQDVPSTYVEDIRAIIHS